MSKPKFEIYDVRPEILTVTTPYAVLCRPGEEKIIVGVLAPGDPEQAAGKKIRIEVQSLVYFESDLGAMRRSYDRLRHGLEDAHVRRTQETLAQASQLLRDRLNEVLRAHGDLDDPKLLESAKALTSSLEEAQKAWGQYVHSVVGTIPKALAQYLTQEHECRVYTIHVGGSNGEEAQVELYLMTRRALTRG